MEATDLANGLHLSRQNQLRLVQQYRLSFFWGGPSLYSVLFKSTRCENNINYKNNYNTAAKLRCIKISETRFIKDFQNLCFLYMSFPLHDMATAKNMGTTGWICFINFARCVKVHNNMCLVYTNSNALIRGYKLSFFGGPITLHSLVHFHIAPASLLTTVVYACLCIFWLYLIWRWGWVLSTWTLKLQINPSPRKHPQHLCKL